LAGADAGTDDSVMATTTATRTRSTALPTTEVRFIEVPDRRCFMIDGVGMPDGQAAIGATAFQEAIQALYGMGYGLHFTLKRRGVTAAVGALEALWTWGDVAGVPPPDDTDAATARWTALLPVPEEATDEEIATVGAELRRRKDPPALDRLRVESLAEGLCAEVMHLGPYHAERPTIERLHAGIAAAGRRPRGLHHEIYISDPRRGDPAKLRTVIRQPVD
jgi:hypothetical protein